MASDRERIAQGRMPKSTQLEVGDSLKVWWSNGHGYSIYVIEDSLRGPHTFKHHSSWEQCETGPDGPKYKQVWS